MVDSKRLPKVTPNVSIETRLEHENAVAETDYEILPDAEVNDEDLMRYKRFVG